MTFSLGPRDGDGPRKCGQSGIPIGLPIDMAGLVYGIPHTTSHAYPWVQGVWKVASLGGQGILITGLPIFPLVQGSKECR